MPLCPEVQGGVNYVICRDKGLYDEHEAARTRLGYRFGTVDFDTMG